MAIGKTVLSRAGIFGVRTPHALQGQRVGIMGGSFNPPHEGHLMVARTALRRLGLDQLWWVVTPGNPLKPQAAVPSQETRMDMCRALTGSDRRMKVTGFEAALGTSYTAATLAFVVRRHPRVRFVWVMGADNLASFDRWQDWRGILATMPVAVVDRPGWHLKSLAAPAAQSMRAARIPESRAGQLAMRRPPAWVFLPARLSHESSTRLRAAGTT